MEEGLFLYGVYSTGYNPPIDAAVKRSVHVLPDSTDPSLRIDYSTSVTTQIALNHVIA